MEFRIADTFTDSLAKLTDQEQRAMKTIVFDLQMNLANPGKGSHGYVLGTGDALNLHRLHNRSAQQRQ